MEMELKDLEEYWPKYTDWCRSNGLFPDFGDYLVWLDDYDIQIGQNDV